MPANPHNHDIEQNLLIIGAGGHGSEVRAYIEALTATQRRLRLLGFIDDNRTRGTWLGTEVLGRLSDLEEFARTRETSIFGYITAFGDNGLRHKIVRTIESFRLRNLHAWTLVPRIIVRVARTIARACLGGGRSTPKRGSPRGVGSEARAHTSRGGLRNDWRRGAAGLPRGAGPPTRKN